MWIEKRIAPDDETPSHSRPVGEPALPDEILVTSHARDLTCAAQGCVPPVRRHSRPVPTADNGRAMGRNLGATASPIDRGSKDRTCSGATARSCRGKCVDGLRGCPRIAPRHPARLLVARARPEPFARQNRSFSRRACSRSRGFRGGSRPNRPNHPVCHHRSLPVAGAVLTVSNIQMKVVNNGTLGNPYTFTSSDPSGQWPGASGIDYLWHLLSPSGPSTPRRAMPARCVGSASGREWRPPTLDPEDRIYRAYDGIINGTRFVNDEQRPRSLHRRAQDRRGLPRRPRQRWRRARGRRPRGASASRCHSYVCRDDTRARPSTRRPRATRPARTQGERPRMGVLDRGVPGLQHRRGTPSPTFRGTRSTASRWDGRWTWMRGPASSRTISATTSTSRSIRAASSSSAWAAGREIFRIRCGGSSPIPLGSTASCRGTLRCARG